MRRILGSVALTASAIVLVICLTISAADACVPHLKSQAVCDRSSGLWVLKVVLNVTNNNPDRTTAVVSFGQDEFGLIKPGHPVIVKIGQSVTLSTTRTSAVGKVEHLNDTFSNIVRINGKKTTPQPNMNAPFTLDGTCKAPAPKPKPHPNPTPQPTPQPPTPQIGQPIKDDCVNTAADVAKQCGKLAFSGGDIDGKTLIGFGAVVGGFALVRKFKREQEDILGNAA